MGSLYFLVFDFKIIILITLIMNFFTTQFLGVAMLIVNTFAAPLSEGEEERRTNMMQNGPGGAEKRCVPNDMMQCAYEEEERGDTNQMQNGGEGEEERRDLKSDLEMEKWGCPIHFEKIPLHYQWHILPTYKCFYLHKDSNGSVATQTFSEAVKTCGEKNSKSLRTH